MAKGKKSYMKEMRGMATKMGLLGQVGPNPVNIKTKNAVTPRSKLERKDKGAKPFKKPVFNSPVKGGIKSKAAGKY